MIKKLLESFGLALGVTAIAAIILFVGGYAARHLFDFVYSHHYNWKVVWLILSVVILTPFYYFMRR
jgi:Kef-type K+ transport system membrane component KefB